MKTTLIAAALLLASAPAVALAPSVALAQSEASAGAVPNSFDRPAATPAPAAPAPVLAQAPDVARSEQTLRGVIAALQGGGFDYSIFSPNLTTQLRQQEAQVVTLVKSFGPLKTVAYDRQQGETQMFKVAFENQATEWLIGFDAEDKVVALRFRPVES